MKGIKNNMDNNEDLKQKLDELRGQKNNLEASMSDLDRQKVQRMVEISNIDEEISKVEADIKEAERLHDELIEAERLATEKKKAEQEEAVRLNDIRQEAEKRRAQQLEAERLEAERLEAEKKKAEQLEAERLEAERLEAEKKKAKQEKAQTMTNPDYSKMLADYNQRIRTYNIGIDKLYKLQNQYEHGKLEYSTYREFAMSLAEMEISLKRDYAQLNELYNKLIQSKSPFEGLTDKQLNERLNKLSNEYKEKWSINNTEGVSLTNLGKLTSDMNAIKDEQAKRKNIAIAKAFSDAELSTNIHTLDSALKSGAYEQDSKKLDEIKSVLALLNNEYAERNFKHLMNLTDEQLDTKLYELNEEYLNEWNYSAHEANGMEDNDISKLDKIKEQIDFLNAAKTARENGVIPKSTLEMPKAPEKTMFILERTNTDLNPDQDKPTPETGTPEPPAPQGEQPQNNPPKAKKQFPNIFQSVGSWFSNTGHSVSTWFSNTFHRKTKALPSSNQSTSTPNASSYSLMNQDEECSIPYVLDKDGNKLPYNRFHDSLRNSVSNDTITTPDNSSKQPVNPNPNGGHTERADR